MEEKYDNPPFEDFVEIELADMSCPYCDEPVAQQLFFKHINEPESEYQQYQKCPKCLVRYWIQRVSSAPYDTILEHEVKDPFHLPIRSPYTTLIREGWVKLTNTVQKNALAYSLWCWKLETEIWLKKVYKDPLTTGRTFILLRKELEELLPIMIEFLSESEDVNL